MALTGTRTFVGFGFGPIQAGLFLQEAFDSGHFRRLVVAEVVPELVQAIRAAGGWLSINVAYRDRVTVSRIGPIEIADPASRVDREFLIERLAEAEEISTAVPSPRQYVSDQPGSLHRLLAAGLRRKAASDGPRAVVYAAENHNFAAEILESRVFEQIPAPEQASVRVRVRFLNTVIGKMSGVIADPSEIALQGLTPITPPLDRAFLVEAFNRILISRIRFEEQVHQARFARGIRVFEEKEPLIPFEEAKLYGHNATHALAAYMATLIGVQRMADLRSRPEVMQFLLAAFVEESGETLIRKHGGIDALFTPAGYRDYAADLLDRMVNPFLNDSADRVGRDPRRKLGWDDRLVGTVREALRMGVTPRRYALGIAAALDFLGAGGRLPAGPLEPLWADAAPDPREKSEVLRLVEEAQGQLGFWRRA